MAGTKNTPAEPTEEQVKQSLYSAATTALRKAHQEEFQTILAGLYEEKGLEYKRRLTPKERAEKKIADLLAEYPDLDPAAVKAKVEGDGPEGAPQA